MVRIAHLGGQQAQGAGSHHNSELACERPELAPPARIHSGGAHGSVYGVEGDGILIVRARHGREDRARSS